MNQAPWLLGLLAGGTIFLGLPVARLRDVTTRTKAFLNAVSTGVLIFLLVEITGHLLEEMEERDWICAVPAGGKGQKGRRNLWSDRGPL